MPEAPGTAADAVSRDPYTQEEVHRIAAATPTDVRAAVGRAVDGGRRWAATDVGARADALRRYADLVDARAAELADLLVREVGKRRADAEGEVAWTALSARWYADHPPRDELVAGVRVARRPLGVIAAVTPWNVPLITPAWKWLPALVAGNAVLWKPSEVATAIALATRDTLVEAGIPGDVLQVLPGAAETAVALCSDERVAGIHFTGSERAGRALAEIGARRFVRCALEMSGHNAAIVLAGADLDAAADCIVACGTALAGQKCTATRRVLVAREERAALEARLRARIDALRVGDPRDPSTDVGPLIGPAARRAADEAVAGAVARGATVAAQAEAPQGDALFAPTLLSGLAADDPLRTHELFAPVMAIESFTTRADAWAMANATPYGLSAAVYTRDDDAVEEAAAHVRAGVLAVNRRGDAVDLEPPFVGRGRSGNGWPEGGAWVYSSLTDLQAVYR